MLASLAVGQTRRELREDEGWPVLPHNDSAD